MRIQGLKGIKGPGDFIETLRKYVFSLYDLKVKPSLKIPILGQHRKHVRVHGRVSVFKGREGVSEPDHPVAFECAEHNSAGVLRGDQGCRGHNVEVAKSPSRSLYVFDGVVFSIAFDFADVKTPIVTLPFEHNSCVKRTRIPSFA